MDETRSKCDILVDHVYSIILISKSVTKSFRKKHHKRFGIFQICYAAVVI